MPDERERLVAAVGRVVAERGYANLTVERVVRYAGVSEDAFDAHFATKEQGLVAAQDAFIERIWLDVHAACDGTGEWPARIRAAIGAVLAALTEASALARAFAIEGIGASMALAERQFAALDRFAELLREGRREFPAAARLPEATERALVGGIASIISGCLLAEEPQAIDRLEPELVELVLIPYLGEAEARRLASE